MANTNVMQNEWQYGLCECYRNPGICMKVKKHEICTNNIFMGYILQLLQENLTFFEAAFFMLLHCILSSSQETKCRVNIETKHTKHSVITNETSYIN